MQSAGTAAPQRLRLISFKGSMRGLVSVEPPIGLRLLDCPMMIGSNRALWVALPARPVLDRKGRHSKPNGRAQYTKMVEWRDRELSDRFSAAVLALIHQAHPHALDEELGR